MADDASMATQVYDQALAYKSQYETYLAMHPGATEASDSTLADLHKQATDGKNWLATNGYADAASALNATYASAQQWGVAHPTLGGSGGGGGSPVNFPTADNTGLTGQISGSVSPDPGTTGAGVVSWWQGITGGKGLGGAVNDVITGNPNQGPLTTIGTAAGDTAANLLGGVSTGLNSVLSVVVDKVAAVVKVLWIPLVVIGGIHAFSRVYRIRRNVTKTGRPLL